VTKSTLKYPLVHVDDVQPENMKKGEGWAISEFRLPISGRDGSSTTLFHSIFRPGSTHAKHLHSNCDEIAVYLKGHGVVGQGGERAEVAEAVEQRRAAGRRARGSAAIGRDGEAQDGGHPATVPSPP